eukprot:gb/GEZJ01006805.1/.p6 GENE.gb/GEZJ01006805.1/~~gb/GEZJ01006805.1/.p6  ORF type:complete len:111 (-),score=20.66 gb/GEZJ01006805.1/:649-981(-)
MGMADGGAALSRKLIVAIDVRVEPPDVRAIDEEDDAPPDVAAEDDDDEAACCCGRSNTVLQKLRDDDGAGARVRDDDEGGRPTSVLVRRSDGPSCACMECMTPSMGALVS